MTDREFWRIMEAESIAAAYRAVQMLHESRQALRRAELLLAWQRGQLSPTDGQLLLPPVAEDDGEADARREP